MTSSVRWERQIADVATGRVCARTCAQLTAVYNSTHQKYHDFSAAKVLDFIQIAWIFYPDDLDLDFTHQSLPILLEPISSELLVL